MYVEKIFDFEINYFIDSLSILKKGKWSIDESKYNHVDL